MRTKRLGSAGPEISVVGFGAWEAGGMWGPGPSDEEMVRAMKAGFDAGISWVDTAEVYGPERSEELVGRALTGRDDVMVFTKVAPTVVVGGRSLGSGLDATGVRAGAEGSLRRLGREVIDLYQVHIPWPEIPVEETWGAMTTLVDDGLVRYIGVSNYDRELVEGCERIRHVDALQIQLSLLKRSPLDELIPFCREQGIGVLAYGPLGFGILSGAVTEETTFTDDDWRSGSFQLPTSQYDDIFGGEKLRRNIQRAAALRPVAERLGITLAQLALAWVTHQDGVTGAITGTRSPQHAAENAAAGAVELDAEDLKQVAEALEATGLEATA